MNKLSASQLISKEQEGGDTDLSYHLALKLQEALQHIRICSHQLKEYSDNTGVHGLNDSVELEDLDKFTGDYKTIPELYWEFVVKVGQIEGGKVILMSEDNINLCRAIHTDCLEAALGEAIGLRGHMTLIAARETGLGTLIQGLSNV